MQLIFYVTKGAGDRSHLLLNGGNRWWAADRFLRLICKLHRGCGSCFRGGCRGVVHEFRKAPLFGGLFFRSSWLNATYIIQLVDIRWFCWKVGGHSNYFCLGCLGCTGPGVFLTNFSTK